ncbi:hypothetical protein MVEN_01873100 [Mycena venus]|uniref:Uncharacterized protein n=1 Tax=Mycena venus TaxID=2733690 RepID=A0A8H7CME1_9AGAR|nr:hypothetical protein MVEN_01873100 [Mycena venus]
MPVSFSVAKHPANSIQLQPTHSSNAMEMLATSCSDQQRYVDEILQCGFSDGAPVEGSGRDLTAKMSNVYPDNKGNGFVNTVITAYNGHHALVIRPDDVWLAILSQFNFFVNANAELLRASFVAHEGQRELVIWAEEEGSRYDVDFARMARQMVNLIDKNVVDPTLREWVMPDFTTTTTNDITVAAALTMATLKQYFSYGFGILCCGIPRVTLEGDRSDWVNILQRLEKLKEYGLETIAWYHLLRPVISRFVAAFDEPASDENVDFWQRVAHLTKQFSGPSYYSGWINAFNVFSKEGTWIGHRLDKTKAAAKAPESLTAEDFWDTYGEYVNKALVLDGTPYHCLDTNKVPPAYAEVDVKLNDNGAMFDCFMLAGVVGTRISSSGDLSLSSSGENDTIHPVPGWWICAKKQNVVSAWEEEQAELEKIMRELDAMRATRNQQLPGSQPGAPSA